MRHLPTKAEVLEYAREIKRERPSSTTEELRQLLQARFVYKVDALAQAHAQGLTIGMINNPGDWLRGLLAITRGILRIIDKDTNGITEIIEGVVTIVT